MSYPTSTGERVKKSIIDRKVREAKAQKLAEHLEQYEYYFCTTCKKNDCKPIDLAHVISVDECQKTGRAELAWDLNNLVVEGRGCHMIRDGLTLGA